MTPASLRQIVCFIAVGAGAALTHWLVAVATVRWGGLTPLLANLAGWMVAFGVSFTGHYRLTFRHQHAPLGRAARRFLLVSAAGFALNELAYAWLLHATSVRYDLLLAAILLGMAVITFLLGRYWAFRARTPPAP